MPSYGPLCTEFYDLDKPSAPADALAFYEARAAEAGGRVLEPMCGSGRFLLPLLKHGICVEGVDTSPAMLAACRRRAQVDGLLPVLYQQSVEQLSLPRMYAMAFIPAGSIGLLEADEGLRTTLIALRRHLHPGAPLFVEVDAVLVDADGTRVVHCPDGSSISYTRRVEQMYTPPSIVWHGVYERRQGSKVLDRENETIVLRKHNVGQLMTTLLACRFGVGHIVQGRRDNWLATSGCILIEAIAHGPTDRSG